MLADVLLKCSVVLKALVTLEMDLLSVNAPNSWPLDRNFLSAEDEIAIFVTPAPRESSRVVLPLLACTALDLVLDQRVHDQKPRVD